MNWLAYFFLGVALLGMLTSSIFLVLTVAGAFRFRSEAKKVRTSLTNGAEFPPVSVLKPVHGMEAQLRENIESFFPRITLPTKFCSLPTKRTTPR